MVAAPFSQFTKSKNSPLRFQSIDQSERQKLAQHAQEVQTFRQERQKLETQAAALPAASLPKQFVPPRVRLPASPIVARPVTELGKGHAPPTIYQAPKPDFKVAPKPRVNRSTAQPQQPAQPHPGRTAGRTVATQLSGSEPRQFKDKGKGR